MNKELSLKRDFLPEKLKYITEYGLDIEKRVIYVFGELTEDLGTFLRIRFQVIKEWWDTVYNKKFDSITLDISSFGGSIYSITSALDFYDELLLDGIKVNTKAHTICMSAATILLAGGTGERTATKRCKFMLHDLQIDNMEGTAKQLQSYMDNINESKIEFFSYYADFANRGNKKYNEKELMREAKKWMKKYTKDNSDHYLSSDEMLKIKLIDKVV